MRPPLVNSGTWCLLGHAGLAVCATCNGGVTLRTGTSKTGKVHRYYTCSACFRSGKTVCKGRSIPMDKLNTLVTEHIADRLLDPERLSLMLSSLASRRAAKAATVDDRITILATEVRDTDDRLRRLYKRVEDGVAEQDDILKDRLVALKADRDRAQAALQRATSGTRPVVDLTPDAITHFGQLMREKLTSGEIPFRKAYIGSIVDRIEVDDHQIRILGRKDVLEQAVIANGGPVPRVRSFVRNWRTLRKDGGTE